MSEDNLLQEMPSCVSCRFTAASVNSISPTDSKKPTLTDLTSFLNKKLSASQPLNELNEIDEPDDN
jgi:hypothetical protein